MTREPIKRGDLVHMTEDSLDYYGTALTSEGRRERVLVQWHPALTTWEEPERLTAFSLLRELAA